MSLASHFTKKRSVQRKARINLSLVREEKGEKHQLSIKTKPSVQASISNRQDMSQVSCAVEEERCKSIDTELGSHTPPVRKDPFAFGFVIEQDTIVSRKSKKRRNRGKKKKRIQESNAQNNSSEVDVKESVSNQIHGQHAEQDILLQCGNADRVGSHLESKGLRTSEDNRVVTPDIDDRFSIPNVGAVHNLGRSRLNQRQQNLIRTPPGFSRSSERFASPVPKSNKTSLKISQRVIQSKPKKMNKAAIITEAELKPRSQRDDMNSSRRHERRVEKDRSLRFNPADKGRAMVNHGSLAVRNERIEEKGDKTADAFSFGFTFDSLLKDYL